MSFMMMIRACLSVPVPLAVTPSRRHAAVTVPVPQLHEHWHPSQAGSESRCRTVESLQTCYLPPGSAVRVK